MEQRKSALRREPDVRFAGRVLVDEVGEPVVYTENLFVKFKDDAEPEDCGACSQEHGLTIKAAARLRDQRLLRRARRRAPDSRSSRSPSSCSRARTSSTAHPELVQRSARKADRSRSSGTCSTTTSAGVPITPHANVEAAHAADARARA